MTDAQNYGGVMSRIGVGKKLPSVEMSPELWSYLTGMSKAALVDCVWDALQLARGDGGEPTLEDARSLCGPTLKARGDREPKIRVT